LSGLRAGGASQRRRLPAQPHGGSRPFHRKSTFLAQLILGPYVVQIWSRSVPISELSKKLWASRVSSEVNKEVKEEEQTKLAKSTVWIGRRLPVHEGRILPVLTEGQLKNNYFAEMRSGSEEGSYLRLIDSCITQLKAQGPSRTCNESKEEEEGVGCCLFRRRGGRRRGKRSLRRLRFPI